MKVCFVTGTLGQGGAERQFVFMLRALIRCGIAVKVLSLTKGEYFEKDVTGLGVPVEFVGESPSRTRRLLHLVRKLRSERVDILQSTHFYTNLYAGLCGRLLGIPSIGAIRSDFVSEVAAHGFLGRWQVAAPRFLVTNSMAAYSRALESGVSPHRIELVRNVVPRSDNQGSKKPSKPITILFVGRLDENKRPEKFVRLAQTILRKHAEQKIRFVVAGDGPLRRDLQQMSSSAGLREDELVFLGSVSDMEHVYKDSHILVSTSKHEGAPNVILEAMASGLPVVATRAGGTSEILADTRGILVETDDDAALSTAVSRLIADADLRVRLGREGKIYVEREHSIDYLETRLPEIYEKVIKDVSAN